jgi:hypothetical protein
MTKTRFSALALGLALGCGGSDKTEAPASIAKAFTIENEQQRAAEEANERDRAERAKEAEAKQRAEAERATQIDAAAVLPATLPPDLASACDALVDAYDAFMTRGKESDALEYYHGGRRPKQGERRASCIKQGDVRVAACQVQALSHEPPSLAELPRVEALQLLLQRCSDKFGKS